MGLSNRVMKMKSQSLSYPGEINSLVISLAMFFLATVFQVFLKKYIVTVVTEKVISRS